MLPWGLSGGRLLPRASVTGRRPFTIVVAVPLDRLPPFTVTTVDELVDVVRLPLLLFVACELLLLQSEARSILEPDKRTSLLGRRHLSLSICTWRKRERERTEVKGLISGCKSHMNQWCCSYADQVVLQITAEKSFTTSPLSKWEILILQSIKVIAAITRVMLMSNDRWEISAENGQFHCSLSVSVNFGI